MTGGGGRPKVKRGGAWGAQVTKASKLSSPYHPVNGIWCASASTRNAYIRPPKRRQRALGQRKTSGASVDGEPNRPGSGTVCAKVPAMEHRMRQGLCVLHVSMLRRSGLGHLGCANLCVVPVATIQGMRPRKCARAAHTRVQRRRRYEVMQRP